MRKDGGEIEEIGESLAGPGDGSALEVLTGFCGSSISS